MNNKELKNTLIASVKELYNFMNYNVQKGCKTPEEALQKFNTEVSGMQFVYSKMGFDSTELDIIVHNAICEEEVKQLVKGNESVHDLANAIY